MIPATAAKLSPHAQIPSFPAYIPPVSFPISLLHHQLSPFFQVIPISGAPCCYFFQLTNKQANFFDLITQFLFLPVCGFKAPERGVYSCCLISLPFPLEPTPSRWSLLSFPLNTFIMITNDLPCHLHNPMSLLHFHPASQHR